MPESSARWVLPGEPLPVRLMNTVWADTAGVHDDLTTATALRGWLTDVAGFDPGSGPGVDPAPAELTEARALRDSLRRVAAFVTDDQRPAARSPVASVDTAVADINAMAADQAWPALLRRGDELRREAVAHAPPVRTALAGLAAQAIDLLTGPSAGALRACHAPHCVLYFVKSHPRREWCSQACGNRVRAARHYRRIRSGRQ
ncbi:ABATE domain-containing protein [Mycobacterium sp. G7A2]|uniref:CGNR zinc finger domain-containing protein n=1 Tax=Mycobacterium sp. G7A2 TaxID=3317307 RepID=UPI0035A8F71B